jgi:hypothetical protein
LSAAFNSVTDDIYSIFNTTRPVAYGGTGGTSVITGWDGLAKKGTDIASASSINLTTATGPSLTITGTTAITGVTLAEGSIRIVRAAGALPITASANLLVNGSASASITCTAEDLLIFRGGAAGVVTVARISATVLAADSDALAATSTSLALKPSNLAAERLLHVTADNLGFSASVSSNALTVTMLGANGSAISATNPVTVPFRNATAATGTPSNLTVTSAQSIVISSGSTMGFTSGVIGRLWIVGFNDAGTFRLGLVNALSGTSIMYLRDGIFSSTAEGGAGAADSAQVIYTGTAVTSKAMKILGYLEATEATAGTWATAPSLLQIWAPGLPLPGDVVQIQRNATGAVASGSTVIPFDDTIPQNTEGDQYLSQAISPTAAANLLAIESWCNYGNSTTDGYVGSCLFQDATANAIAAAWGGKTATANTQAGTLLKHKMLAATTSSTTMKIRGGSNTAGTTTFNGTSAARKWGGVFASYLEVAEIMA